MSVFGKLGVASLLALGAAIVPTMAQSRGKAGQDREAVRRVVARIHRSDENFALGKRRLQLELETLLAQVEAKRAEIARAEAMFRIEQLAPDLAILTALDLPVTLHFGDDTPLDDILKFIKDATSDEQAGLPNGIPIYVDPSGMQAANKTMSSAVSIDLEGVPLRTTLRLIVKQLGLSYAVRDGVLTISTFEKLEEEPPGPATR